MMSPPFLIPEGGHGEPYGLQETLIVGVTQQVGGLHFNDSLNWVTGKLCCDVCV